MLHNIVITGGGSLLPGLQDRLRQEMVSLNPTHPAAGKLLSLMSEGRPTLTRTAMSMCAVHRHPCSMPS